MIDCARCRSLIDDDLRAQLDPPARAAMANHLRTCHGCVDYKRERLRDASMIGRSVAELDERERAAPPPPPAPSAPRAWPWVAVALGVAGAVGIGAHLLVTPDTPADSDGPPRAERRPERRVDETTTPVAARAPVAPDPAPTVPAPRATEPAVGGVVADRDGTTPASDATVAIYSPSAGRILAVTRTDPSGAFAFTDVLPPADAVVCVRAGNAIAGPANADASRLLFRLRPARVVDGRIAVDGLAATDCRLLVRWPGGGAVPCTPGPDGLFRAVGPTDAAVEILASPSTARFVLRPHRHVTLATRRPVTLRGVRAAMVRVDVQGPSKDDRPIRCAVLDGRGEEVTRLTRDVDGRWIGAVARGTYRVAVAVPGFDAVEHPVSVDPDAEAAPIVVRLAASARTLTLRVTDPSDGLAAHVTRHPPLGPNAPPIVRAFDGVDTLVLPGMPWRSVRVRLVDRLSVDAGVFDAPGDHRLAFGNDAVVEGRVTATDGAALAGVLVRLQTGPDRRFTYTDANGHYAFDDVPIGPAVVCPASLADAIEQGRMPSAPYEVVATPGARIARPLELGDARLGEVRVRDETGRPTAGTLSVRSENGELAQRVQASVDPTAGVSVATIPAVLPGSYRVDWTENGVIYPLGRLVLPGAGECVVRRGGGTLRIAPTWASPFAATAGRAWLSIDDDGGQLLHRMPLGSLGTIALGGLDPGRYHITIRVGSSTGHAIADVPGGAGVVPIAIR